MVDIFKVILGYLDSSDLLNYIDVSKEVRVICIDTIKLLPILEKDDIMTKIVTYNNVNLLKLLINNNLHIKSELLCLSAASSGALNIIIWLYNNRSSRYPICELIKWNPKYGFNNLKVICRTSINNNDKNILAWLLSIGYIMDDNILSTIIWEDKREIINYLNKKRYLLSYGKSLYVHAVQSENIDFLTLIQEHLSNKNELYKIAISQEQYKILKWINDNIGPYDETTAYLADRHSNLKVLICLKNNECPWD